jgi:hypothetical protein
MQCDWKSGSIDEMKSVGEDCECKALDKQTTVKATAEIDRVNRTSLFESARRMWFSWAIIGRNGTEAVGIRQGRRVTRSAHFILEAAAKSPIDSVFLPKIPANGTRAFRQVWSWTRQRGPFVRHGRGRGDESLLVQNAFCGGICSQIPFGYWMICSHLH